MSYCRWSSNNWDCDLYCYADVYGGYTTHVASLRHKGPIPELPDVRKVSKKEWQAAYNAQHRALNEDNLKPIGLPYDGQSFNDADLQSFLDRVLMLKEVGYHVPDYVIETIEQEKEKP